MPAALSPVTYEPIRAFRVLSQQGALPQLVREAEAATQTWKIGVPVRIVSGYLQECTFAGADIVYGISAEPAHNLAVAGTAQDLSEGTPQNQTSAIITPIGAWIRDGRCGVYAGNGQTVFSVALKLGQVFAQTLIVPGTYYQLVKDATSGFWYLDNTLTGGNAGVANLIGNDPSAPNDAVLGARVFFTLNQAKRFFQ